MKIMLTKAANMDQGGYSWVMEGETEQWNVAGLVLDTVYHNDTTLIQEMSIGGFGQALEPGEVLVSSTALERAGFKGFSSLPVFKFLVTEFEVIEE